MPHNDFEDIHRAIRVIPNWPEPGVSFRDITTLLQNAEMFHKVIDVFVARYKDLGINVVAGLDARGFIFGPVVAYKLNVGFVPIRKQGKLPYSSIAQAYDLEYGSTTVVEVHTDAVAPMDNVLIIDDLIATGGTMLAACKLINRLGANVAECAVVNDLLYLNGSKLIRDKGFKVYSILEHTSK